jgi:hypothetical protein
MSSHSSSDQGAARLSSDVLLSADSKSDLLARARHDRIQRELELSTAIGATYRALVGQDATPCLIAAGLRDAIARQVESGVMLERDRAVLAEKAENEAKTEQASDYNVHDAPSSTRQDVRETVTN